MNDCVPGCRDVVSEFCDMRRTDFATAADDRGTFRDPVHCELGICLWAEVMACGQRINCWLGAQEPVGDLSKAVCIAPKGERPGCEYVHRLAQRFGRRAIGQQCRSPITNLKYVLNRFARAEFGSVLFVHGLANSLSLFARPDQAGWVRLGLVWSADAWSRLFLAVALNPPAVEEMKGEYAERDEQDEAKDCTDIEPKWGIRSVVVTGGTHRCSVKVD